MDFTCVFGFPLALATPLGTRDAWRSGSQRIQWLSLPIGYLSISAAVMIAWTSGLRYAARVRGDSALAGLDLMMEPR